MPCLKCAAVADYHSFRKFGEFDGASLFYTAPAKTMDYNEDGTKLANVKIHVSEDTLQKPWIWVLDCANMGVAQYTEMSFNIGLLGLLGDDKNLRGVWIINPNTWISASVTFLKTFYNAPILDSIKYLEGSKLELSNMLESMKVDRKSVSLLLRK